MAPKLRFFLLFVFLPSAVFGQAVTDTLSVVGAGTTSVKIDLPRFWTVEDEYTVYVLADSSGGNGTFSNSLTGLTINLIPRMRMDYDISTNSKAKTSYSSTDAGDKVTVATAYKPSAGLDMIDVPSGAFESATGFEFEIISASGDTMTLQLGILYRPVRFR